MSLPHKLKRTLNIKGSYGNCWYERLSCLQQKMRALNRLCLCDQYLSGPIHWKPGVFIAARASSVGVIHKGRLGFCCSLHCLIKWVSSERGAPRHKDTKSATKGELYQFWMQAILTIKNYKIILEDINIKANVLAVLGSAIRGLLYLYYCYITLNSKTSHKSQ